MLAMLGLALAIGNLHPFPTPPFIKTQNQNLRLMASAMKKAIEAGREAYLAGRMPRKQYGSPSSPLGGSFLS